MTFDSTFALTQHHGVIALILCITFLLLLIIIPPLRTVLKRQIKRANLKYKYFAENPEKTSAYRSWGNKYRWVHGKEAPSSFHFYPEQAQTRRELKKLLPSRFVESQAKWWTVLYFAIVYLCIGCVVFALSALFTK